MASVATAEQVPEVFSWLKNLPLAPEYHPTLSEFQDPIAYILKIEKEASKYGICKIVPPLPPLPKKTAIANLNRSLAARNPSSNPKSPPTFTTRQQQIGFCPRKPRPVQKPVWQSGQDCTLQQFEAKAKQFEKAYLKKTGKKGLSPLEIETLFWKASVDKPISVDYANDMPGSAFAPVNEKKWRESGEATTIGETAWNMRGVSRAKGSLLSFMKEEIPGVTSPMVYIAMMFSWFAWHVEDHDLHSLNYLHTGAGKTWYGVPREAAVAFEEVIRVHGYGGEVNPLVTFAILGEKTTVMSPEVLIRSGIPCCRLVQNAGEFVVTFPRAYHSGFSHGFNCGEAANIATPGWLMVAKEAAIRRASINYPPMVSHFHLLYALALALCSRIPVSIGTEPRSSRLKDKKRGEGETMVKELFVQNVMQNNGLLHVLGKGTSCVLLPQNSSEISLCSNLHVRAQLKVKPRLSLGLCSPEEALELSKSSLSNDTMLDRNARLKHLSGFNSSVCEQNRLSSLHGNDNSCTSTPVTHKNESEDGIISRGDGLLDQGLFSCVTCGILSFACVAVIQPKEAAARYLMSADCSFFNDWTIGSGVARNRYTSNEGADTAELNYCSGRVEESVQDGLYDVPVQSGEYHVQPSDESIKLLPGSEVQKGISSLELLASAYGNTSDSEDQVEPETSISTVKKELQEYSLYSNQNEWFRPEQGVLSSKSEVTCDGSGLPSTKSSCGHQSFNSNNTSQQKFDYSARVEIENQALMESKTLDGTFRDPMTTSRRMAARSACVHQSDLMRERIECGHADYATPSNLSHISNCSPVGHFADATEFGNADISLEKMSISLMHKSDDDSSRMHIFCLEHAVEVEKQLRPIGGVHILLLCHPEYPKVEAEAKSLAEELGIDYIWNDIPFREASLEDRDRIQSALASEEAIHGNGDWAVKLGINLYYSANLSRSPLYSKQMPYNVVIYNAFGRSSPTSFPEEPKVLGKGPGKQKKIVVAGKWCGKVWMSNQVHPYLAQRDDQELEHEGSFHGRAMLDEKRESNLESIHQTGQFGLSGDNSRRVSIAVTRKPGRKRKETSDKGSSKKLKCPQAEAYDTEDGLSENNSPLHCGRILRSGQMKQDTPQLHDSCKRKIRSASRSKDENEGGPSTRLRKRPSKLPECAKQSCERQTGKKKANKVPANKNELRDEEAEYQCDMDGCSMSFSSKHDLMLHKRNICSVKGCGKKFFSHKYLVQHRKVHIDDRPLKCPWKGCKMTFKWAWARTEHIRVHTGARPYVCHEAGCGQTFRFVSDFSRHKRKTGHSAKKAR